MAKRSSFVATLAVIYSILAIADTDDGVICDRDFCSNYLVDTGCTSANAGCSSNTGLWLPSPTVCNCCDFCIPLIQENSTCSVGGMGDGYTIGRCGDGLSCQQGLTSATCQRMDTACHRAQDDYDRRYSSGDIGFLEEKPRCDGKGNYGSISCTKTQTCHCQSENGERIFGESLFHDSSVFNTMQCGCSRRYHKTKNIFSGFVEYPIIGPRCTRNGGFNPVQCVLNLCYCVNEISGAIDSSNVIDLSEKPVTELPCYDPRDNLLVLDTEPPYSYNTPCLQHRNWLIEKIQESIALGYDISYFTTMIDCLSDGSYTRISKENGKKICVDHHGKNIGDFSADSDTLGYNDMDCYCAQTNLLMEGMQEKPVCCKNGNFRPMQFRRGFYFCVDRNGKQTHRESKIITQLPCYTTDWKTC